MQSTMFLRALGVGFAAAQGQDVDSLMQVKLTGEFTEKLTDDCLTGRCQPKPPVKSSAAFKVDVDVFPVDQAENSSSKACIVFGSGGIAEAHDCNSLDELLSLPQTKKNAAGWVIELDSGLALLNGDARPSTVTIWSESNGVSEFTEIELGDMVTPVGGAYLDGKLYVACFGSWPTPQGDSGLAIIDVPGRRLEATHPFADPNMHLHNAYAFEFGGRREVFVAVLGNPWSESGPLAGLGLLRFDRSSSAFALGTTVGANLSIRSAKQQHDGSIFALTQEPYGQDTKLVRMEQSGSQLKVVAQTTLPHLPQGGDGGADVVLGVDTDTLWVTDRQGWSPGLLHYYQYSSGRFTKVNTRSTGANPRYLVTLDNGDVITCNQNGNDLSVFPGLAFNPLNSSIAEHRIGTVTSPQFLIQTSKIAVPRARRCTKIPNTAVKGRSIRQGGTRFFYTSLRQCEDICDKVPGCAGFVDNRNAEKKYCVFKTEMDTYTKTSKDSWKC